MTKKPKQPAVGLETLAQRAKEGDKHSLEELVRAIQDRIYGLAMRMLFLPADAEDATQEILVKIITHLDAFRGESEFFTWVYRVAANHLLSTHRRRAERWQLSFDKYEEQIEAGIQDSGPMPYAEAERDLIVQESKLSCMQGMLLCLTREVRIAFILGEVFGVTGVEGGQIMDISPAAFRQRLSRGRKQIRDYMIANCGLVKPDNPCHCGRQLFHDIRIGWIDPENLRFARHPRHEELEIAAKRGLEDMDEAARVTALFRQTPAYAAPDSFVEVMRNLLESGKFQCF